jgi:hypothetical protein
MSLGMLVGNRPLSSKPWQLQSLPLSHSLTRTLSAAAAASTSCTELCFLLCGDSNIDCLRSAVVLSLTEVTWSSSTLMVTCVVVPLLLSQLPCWICWCGGSTYETRQSDLIHVMTHCAEPSRKRTDTRKAQFTVAIGTVRVLYTPLENSALVYFLVVKLIVSTSTA